MDKTESFHSVSTLLCRLQRQVRVQNATLLCVKSVLFKDEIFTLKQLQKHQPSNMHAQEAPLPDKSHTVNDTNPSPSPVLDSIHS
jgi:hypothetical protein